MLQTNDLMISNDLKLKKHSLLHCKQGKSNLLDNWVIIGALLCPYMTSQTSINMSLVDDIVMAIPDNEWDRVKEKFVELFVDNMPNEILRQLTGDVEGFSKAETILTEYYEPDHQRIELIIDAFKIIGPEQTVYHLDLLGIVPEEQEDTIESDLTALS